MCLSLALKEISQEKSSSRGSALNTFTIPAMRHREPNQHGPFHFILLKLRLARFYELQHKSY